MSLLAVPARLLDLGIDARDASRGYIESLDELQLLLERRYLERRFARGKALGIHGLAGLGIDAFVGLEGLDFRQREIERVIMAVVAFAVAKFFGHIADRLELDVMHH